LKKKSKLFISFIVVFVVLAVAIIAGNIFAENKLKSALEENLSKAQIEYEKINVSLLGRSASLSNANYKKNGIQLAAEELKLDGIDILEYLTNKNIEISTLKLTKPDVVIYSEKQNEEEN